MNPKKGIAAAVLAYGLWGLLPIYWKALQSVPPTEILLHRIVWSLGAVWLLLRIKGSVRNAFWKIKCRRIFKPMLISSALIGANWLTYIYAVNSGYILEASLGYFIAPLCQITLGCFLLGEKLNPKQWASVSLATIAVIYLSISQGSFPWLGLMLAGSFSFYSFVRKTAPVEALEGLFLETLILAIPGIAYMGWLEGSGQGAFLSASPNLKMLLIAAGPITALPLLWFAMAAKNLKLSTLGLCQYITPTIQFLMAIFIYGEPLDNNKLFAFSLIWLGLAVFTLDNIRANKMATVKTFTKPKKHKSFKKAANE